MSRPWAALLSIGFVVATLAPAFHDEPWADDSYPLSTYPMFARSPGKRALVTAVGVEPSRVVRLGPELVANDEPMQALRTLRTAAEGGRSSLRSLCARIAERVEARPELARVRRVRIVRATFDPIRYFEVAPEPESSEALVTCRVVRKP